MEWMKIEDLGKAPRKCLKERETARSQRNEIASLLAWFPVAEGIQLRIWKLSWSLFRNVIALGVPGILD